MNLPRRCTSPAAVLLAVAAWAIAPLAIAANPPADRGPARRPNVVFFLADDLGYGDLARNGNPHVKTPELDKFARDAVVFNRFYVSPICHPTRASLMTGRYALRTFEDVSFHMHPAEVTVAQMLQKAGYKTGLFGKWHLGDGPTERPTARGFDEVVTFTKGQLPKNDYFNPKLLHNDKPEKFRGYCMDVFTTAAIEFIKENRDKPFFVYLPANLIHEPLAAPKELMKPYKEAGLGGNLPTLYGMIASTDGNFGRLRSALAQLGLEDNTLLIFASDNGPQIRAPNECERSAGLNGLKGTIYEGGIRTPCFMQWPAKQIGRKKIDRIAAHVDILPTILDACGAAPPPEVKLDGRSLLPLLRDPAAAWPERTLFIQFDSNGEPRREMAFSAITERWKLVQPCGADSTLIGLNHLYGQLCEAQGRPQRGIGGNKPRFELYDIAADPKETKDLAAEHPEIVKDLRGRYNAWFDDVVAHARWPKTARKAPTMRLRDEDPKPKHGKKNRGP